MKAELIEIRGETPHTRITWYCPGCGCHHGVPTPPDIRAWQWNGSLGSPSLRPSVLIRYNGPDAGSPGSPMAVCHCFVTNGKIEFLSDCTHPLAGTTVEMKDIDE